MATDASPQARSSIHEAFDRLRRSVSADDARDFQSITLQHVRTAAQDIERQLAARQCLRNMRRIQPFLEGLERYSKAVEVLCNGTPYLPWVWAPVKLMLQVLQPMPIDDDSAACLFAWLSEIRYLTQAQLASDYTTAFEKLITAYGQIGDVLPRFDRLSAAFKDNHDFQRVLGFVYADILDFHGRAYQFFRRRGWRCFFSSCWARFDLRFKGILESLARNCELVDREAASISIVETKAWRTKVMEEAAKKERESAILQFQAVISWLQVGDSLQEDELDQLLHRCHLGTCDWITRNPKISAWMRHGMDQKILWLKGKPGSGKSVLCAKIAHFMQQDQRTVVLYYFCNNYGSSSSSNSSQLTMILRSLCGQLLRANFDLSAYLFDEYISKGLNPSLQNLKMILPSLLSGIQSVRILIDGVDECDQTDITKILRDIIPLANCDGVNTTHKLLVSSRDIPKIGRILAKKPTISLSEEKDAVDAAIRTYVHASIVELHDRLESDISCGILEDVENKIVEKADGMFLWVRLVLATLDDADSVKELKDAVDTLPRGLKQTYGRILENIEGRLGAKEFEKALRILGWMAFARRPLKDFELQDGIALHVENTKLDHETKLWKNVFDVCKPLIEEDRLHRTIVFVHFSIKEYMLDTLSGPFIAEKRAHHDIAFACVAYLANSFELIDDQVSKGSLLIRVAGGFDGLQLYANAFWLDHVLAYVDISTTLDADASCPLVMQLLRLCNTYQQHSSTSGAPGMTTLQTDRRLNGLSGYADIHAMAQQVLVTRQTAMECQQQNDLSKDSTFFGRLLQTYNDIVQELLTARIVPGLPQEALALFKERYGPWAYVCRYYGCERATVGFASPHDLEKHKSTHLPKLVCNILTCEYAVIGFRTFRALKQHLEAFHATEATTRIPRTLRRTQKTFSTREEQLVSSLREQERKVYPAEGPPLPIPLRPQPGESPTSILSGPYGSQAFTRLVNMEISVLAKRIAENTPRADLEKIRANLSRMPDQQRALLEQRGIDPLAYFFRQHAAKIFLTNRQQGQQATSGGIAGNRYPQAPQQPIPRANMGVQSLPAGAVNGTDSFFGSLENFVGQQQANAMSAAGATQLVVPASTGQRMPPEPMAVFPNHLGPTQAGQLDSMRAPGMMANPNATAQHQQQMFSAQQEQLF